jgi:hypothetical protein
MGQSSGGNCINCDKWWRDPLEDRPTLGICRRDMDYDFAHMAGRVHETKALHVCKDFIARDAQESAGPASWGADETDPALVICAGGAAR